MNQSATNMLGLSARAGKVITGEKAVVQSVRAGGCYLAILDGSVAGNGEKAVTQACTTHGVPLLKTDSGQLGAAIGKPNRMAAGITDRGLANRILELSK